MVFLTALMMFPRHSKNVTVSIKYWKRRQVLKLSTHFWGRSRTCFSLAIRRLQRSLKKVHLGRKLRKTYMKQLWASRIDAGCQELGEMPEGSRTMLEGLSRSNILLNRQVLADFAIWEPRTFESLNKIAAARARGENIARALGPYPRGILGKL